MCLRLSYLFSSFRKFEAEKKFIEESGERQSEFRSLMEIPLVRNRTTIIEAPDHGRLRTREIEEQFHFIFIGVERSERAEILCARIALGDHFFSSAPGEFRLAVFYSDDVGHHPGVAAVPVGKRMDLRNKLVMKPDETLVEREWLVFQPILHVADELWNALQNLAGIAANVQFMLAIRSRPLPYLAEHFGVEGADVRFVQRVR